MLVGLRNSKHKSLSFELENKFLCNQLHKVKEDVARLKNRIIFTKKLLVDYD
jgi:hypothetical protein